MHVTVEDQSSVKKIIHIEVPEADVTQALDSAYDELRKTVKVKGFRQGKAPRNVLVGMYKKDVHADVASKLIQNTCLKAIEETKLNILGQPVVESLSELNDKGSYKYDAIVEIRPEIAAIEYKGLALTKYLYRATEEEVDAQLQMLQKNQAKLEKISEDRPAQEGDAVLIDLEGSQNGNPVPAFEKSENTTLQIGEGKISKDFDAKLIGMMPGESKTFDITFPQDHNDPQLAGGNVSFLVTLKEIREEILPELNDEFAKKLGPFETIEAVKQQIKAHLTEGYEKRIEQELHEQIYDALAQRVDFELPEILVNYELNSMYEETKMSFAAQNMDVEKLGFSFEVFKEKYLNVAENKARRHLILGQIITQESIELSNEEFEKELETLAQTVQQPIDIVKKHYNDNPDSRESFRFTLLEKKALELILSESVIEEKEPELVTSDDKGNDETS